MLRCKLGPIQLGPHSKPSRIHTTIVDDPGTTGGYSLHKYTANKHAYTLSYPRWGPHFGTSLVITDRCQNERSLSFLAPDIDEYGVEGVNLLILFGEDHFRVREF
jgi:hypothetical protein